MLPNALWGLAMPTIQSLMTRRVSESEQGQLQGANNSVGAIAGVLSPLFFGAVYSISVGPEAWFPHPGRSEEHTSELQSLMRISYAVFCLKKKKVKQTIKKLKSNTHIIHNQHY